VSAAGSPTLDWGDNVEILLTMVFTLEFMIFEVSERRVVVEFVDGMTWISLNNGEERETLERLSGEFIPEVKLLLRGEEYILLLLLERRILVI